MDPRLVLDAATRSRVVMSPRPDRRMSVLAALSSASRWFSRTGLDTAWSARSFTGGQSACQERRQTRVEGQRAAIAQKARGDRQAIDAQQLRVDLPRQALGSHGPDPSLHRSAQKRCLQYD